MKKTLLFLLLMVQSVSSFSKGKVDYFKYSVPSSVRCMADNLYQEARGETIEGVVAVGQVVLNRVKSPKWPNSICEVVYQNKVNIHGYTVYQFSWVGKPDKEKFIDDWNTYRLLLDISELMILGWYQSAHKDLYFYYACDGKQKIDPPFWANYYKEVVKIENHCFYSLEEK